MKCSSLCNVDVHDSDNVIQMLQHTACVRQKQTHFCNGSHSDTVVTNNSVIYWEHAKQVLRISVMLQCNNNKTLLLY